MNAQSGSERPLLPGQAPHQGEPPVASWRILCVDDDSAIRLAVTTYLQDLGHEATPCPSGEHALTMLSTRSFDAVLLDLSMPGMSGLEVLERVRRDWPDLPVLVVSGTGVIRDVIEALRHGAWDFISKPVEDLAILEHALGRALERARLIRDNRRHHERLEALVAERTALLEREILERKAMEVQLRASLKEKEVLLREIHHRVKNNLQVVSSLLSLQALKHTDPKLAEPFLDSQTRVRAMALVHEKLYRSGDLTGIDFDTYLRDLALFLIQSYSPRGLSIAPDIRSQAFALSVDAAIPCGLILNELITNSLKHAFAGRTSGVIRLAAWTDGGQANLTVEDNGVGLPKGFDVQRSETLGLQLVVNLARQLRGHLEVDSSPNGARFHLRFPL